MKDGVFGLNFKYEDAQKFAHKTAKKLSDESNRLFRRLTGSAQSGDTDEESDRFTVELDADAARHLRNMRDIADRLLEVLTSEPIAGNGSGRKAQIIWELTQARDQAAAFARCGELICWLETNENENRLCAIPKDLDRRLYSDLWSGGVPTVFTSGTLSANGDFSHIKRTLGLEHAGIRLTETSKPSPFDYHKNALLYISENVPFPDQRDKGYIAAVTDEIERLIIAAHGHSAVLFTSYNTMGLVYTTLKNRGLPFPMFRLDKGGIREIERFKQSGNAVLFASGSLWEGIDIPGDALSLLIIVRIRDDWIADNLPFRLIITDTVGLTQDAQESESDISKRLKAALNIGCEGILLMLPACRDDKLRTIQRRFSTETEEGRQIQNSRISVYVGMSRIDEEITPHTDGDEDPNAFFDEMRNIWTSLGEKRNMLHTMFKAKGVCFITNQPKKIATFIDDLKTIDAYNKQSSLELANELEKTLTPLSVMNTLFNITKELQKSLFPPEMSKPIFFKASHNAANELPIRIRAVSRIFAVSMAKELAMASSAYCIPDWLHWNTAYAFRNSVVGGYLFVSRANRYGRISIYIDGNVRKAAVAASQLICAF